MPEAFLILPSADAKRAGGRPGTRYADARRDARANRFPDLDAAREQVASALHKALEVEDGLEELLDAKGALLTAAIERNALLYEATVCSALERYEGAFYRQLAYGELPAKARDALHERAVIVSGLLGLAAPTDLVPDYKLPLGKSLPGVGDLREFWCPRVTPVLDKWAEGRLVWNLLDAEATPVWASNGGPAGIVTVRFVEHRNGRSRALAHTNRALKGTFARHLVTRGWALASAEKFEVEGYRFDPEASSVVDGFGEMVFAKRV